MHACAPSRLELIVSRLVIVETMEFSRYHTHSEWGNTPMGDGRDF